MDRVIYYDVSLDDSPAFDIQFSDNQPLDTTIESQIRIAGSTSYLALNDKPKIEGVTLEGDKSFRALGLDEITPQDIDEIIFGGD